MKIALVIVATAFVCTACATDRETRHARWKARDIALCPEKSRVYESGVFVSCKQSGQLTEEARRASDNDNSYRYYGGNTAENVRNTPYERWLMFGGPRPF